jgi:hypothetical protein
MNERGHAIFWLLFMPKTFAKKVEGSMFGWEVVMDFGDSALRSFSL